MKHFNILNACSVVDLTILNDNVIKITLSPNFKNCFKKGNRRPLYAGCFYLCYVCYLSRKSSSFVCRLESGSICFSSTYRYTIFFFYKNLFCKNVQREIFHNIKNTLRKYPRFREEQFIFTTFTFLDPESLNLIHNVHMESECM